MKIVIDIPEREYNTILNNNYTAVCACPHLLSEAIKNGVVLPKGYGDLIDTDELLKSMDTWDKFGYTETGAFVRNPQSDYVPYVHYEDMVNCVLNSPTIIESDKRC